MITGEKVELRGMTKECSAQIYAWVNDEKMRPCTGTVYPVSEQEHERWMESVATDPNRRQFLICKREDGTCIGTIGLKNFDWIGRQAEIYASIGVRENRGQGYGGDALKTLTRFAFEQLNLHRVYCHIFASNKGSLRCLDKVGYTAEGVLRESHFSGGKYEDTVVLAMLDSEMN